MACGTVVIWSRVPVGSIFKLSAAGDEHHFNASASVSLNGTSRPQLRHRDIVPGPASVEIDDKGQRWVIKPVVVLTSDTKDPVVLKAQIEDANGGIVQVPDGLGGKRDAKCEWSIDEAALSPLAIRISIRSVTS